jgi:hypothetical protein
MAIAPKRDMQVAIRGGSWMWVTVILCGCGSNGGAQDPSSGSDAASDAPCSVDGAACPSVPAADARADAPSQGPSVDASPADCPATEPTTGQSCTQELGCLYGSTCAWCAPTVMGAMCSSAGACIWGLQPLGNPAPCPPSAPVDGTMCGSSATCYYCSPNGLTEALCLNGADTYTWSVALMYHASIGNP